MTRTENLSHPSAELKLPLNKASQVCVIPTKTTLFFWGAIAPGTSEKLAPADTPQGRSQISAGKRLYDQISWSISIDGEAVPLLSKATYRNSGYHGLAWWVAHDPVTLPTTVDVHFQTTGEQPTVDGEPLVLWSESGTRIPWNESVKSTIHLQPPDNHDRGFSTHGEQLWGQHLVYEPQYSEL
jgi:hypothetical protein